MKAKKTENAVAAGGFFSEAQEELRKVSTPTRQETIQATIVTLVIVAFVAIMLAVFDVAFNSIMKVVL